MPGPALTEQSQMMCPHGGTVTVTSANSVLKAGGAKVLVASDVGTVAGCVYTLPGPKPSPCVNVRWESASAEAKTSTTAGPVLSVSAVGTCYSAEQAAQGTVVILGTQAVMTAT